MYSILCIFLNLLRNARFNSVNCKCFNAIRLFLFVNINMSAMKLNQIIVCISFLFHIQPKEPSNSPFKRINKTITNAQLSHSSNFPLPKTSSAVKPCVNQASDEATLRGRREKKNFPSLRIMVSLHETFRL